MIGRLQGTLLDKQIPTLLIDVGGVGYEVDIPLSTYYRLPAPGQPVTLHTHFVVREDAQLLYGFAVKEERALFRALIKISGVGPKLALAILSGIEPESFLRCIERDDVVTLTKIPGVGKKTAERVVIEMRDKLKELTGLAARAPSNVVPIQLVEPLDAVGEAESALVALGYKPAEATKAVAAVKADHDSAENMLRAALKRMVK